MRIMRILALTLLLLVPLSGADCEQERVSNYNGSVTVKKTNGMVTAVEVNLMGQQGCTTVYNRKDAMAFTAQLESILTDLKAATDQFPVDESKQEQKKEK